MRLRLATVACAAALVALLAAPTPARAFNLFPSHWTREETHAEPFSEEARERAELTRTCPDHCGAETRECSATSKATARRRVKPGACTGPIIGCNAYSPEALYAYGAQAAAAPPPYISRSIA